MNTPTLALLSRRPLIVYPVLIVIATWLTLKPGGVGTWIRLSAKFGLYSWFVGSNSTISNFLSTSLIKSWVLTTCSIYLSLTSLCSANFLQLVMQSATSSSSLAILVTAKALLSSIYLNNNDFTFRLFFLKEKFPTQLFWCFHWFWLTFIWFPLTLSCKTQYFSKDFLFIH